MTGARIRAVDAQDSPALARLAAASSDGGRIAFAPRHHVPVVEAARAKHLDVDGVVAETPDGTVVGAGWVSFERCHLGTEVGEVALLHSLAVNPEHRRQGIAAALTRWRLHRAAERKAVVVAAIQAGNAASEANARSWSTQTLGTLVVTPSPIRGSPPRPGAGAGVSVRRAQSSELGELSERIESFSAEHVLSPAVDEHTLARWLDIRVAGQPLNHYFVAVDDTGRLLAGLGIEEEARLSSLEVVRMPVALRVAARLLKVVPADRRMRNLVVRMPWFVPGQGAAARYLWEYLRWEWRDRGSSLVTTLDATSPLTTMLYAPRWMPRTTLRIVGRSDTPLPEGRLISPVV